MKRLKSLATAAVAAVSFAWSSQAQDTYPSKPIKLIVPFAAGGPTDIVSRVMGERMSQLLGQPVIIENLAGAGGMIGGVRVAQAAPDGYTMVMGTAGTHAQLQSLHVKPQYDASADFTPVALIANIPLVILTKKDLPVTDLQSFITYTKENQKKMTYASSGAGAALHIGTVLFNMSVGVDVDHVPYRGSAPAMQDLVGGRVDYMLEVVSTAKPQIDNGAVKAIAMMQASRSPVLPNVATVDEQGLKGVYAYTWNALFLPKGAPADIVKKLNDAAAKASSDPVVKKKLEDLGYTVATTEQSTPDYLGKFVAAEIAKWAIPIKASGFKVE
jgi:tripartite-type tricarboxylate transporter receptor subunit TctC